MTAAQLVSLGIQLSMAIGVFCVAMDATPEAVRRLIRQPGLLTRMLLAMFVIMPLFAVALAGAFDLRTDLEIALVCLALSPVPPILPSKQIKAGGTSSHVLALLAVSAVASVVFVPLALWLLGLALGRRLEVPEGSIVQIAVTSLLLPLAAGVIVRHFAPDFARRIARKLALAANVLLLVTVLPVLFSAWRNILALFGSFTLLAILAFVAVGLAAGHLLGGPVEGDRTVLALATATRHPAVAIAIAHAVAPHQNRVGAAVILYLVVATIFSMPYVRWRRKGAEEALPHPAA